MKIVMEFPADLAGGRRIEGVTTVWFWIAQIFSSPGGENLRDPVQ